MNQNQLKTAVLFVVFNRPDTTKIVFEAVRKTRPMSIYIAADGPRTDKPEDAEKCQLVREIFTHIDWPCKVHTLFSEKNLGCKVAESKAFTWFFENVEQGIIFEDDCLPDPSFFPFCEELLEKYKDDERVMMISGNNFQQKNPRFKCEDSYYFSRIPITWGWASWRRAWKHYDMDVKKWPETKKSGALIPVFKNRGAYAFWSKLWDKYYIKKVDSYDGQWFFACALHQGFCINPKVTLVSNIGLGNDATHMSKGTYWFANLPTETMVFPLTHPEKMVINYSADNSTFKWIFNIDKKFHHRLVRPLKTAFPNVYKKFRYVFSKKNPQTKNRDTQTIFTDIFNANAWNGKDSVSGTGSDMVQTRALIKELPTVLKELNIASMLDIPCGDFHWMQKVDLNGIQYTGADIVKEIVERDIKLYEKENVHFIHLDVMKDDVPKVDLVLVRDCLVHFSFEDIKMALKNICKSQSGYLLTTTFPEHHANADIRTGKWRTLDLTSSPFNFPKPLRIINEECTESNNAYTDKSLGLWKISDIAKIIE